MTELLASNMYILGELHGLTFETRIHGTRLARSHVGTHALFEEAQCSYLDNRRVGRIVSAHTVQLTLLLAVVKARTRSPTSLPAVSLCVVLCHAWDSA